MPPPRSGRPAARTKRFCFTLNNYTDAEVTALTAALSDPGGENVAYAVYGKEVAPETGTPHLQGYVRFSSMKTMASCKTYLGSPRYHFEVSRGTEEQNRQYCIKSNDFVEFGTFEGSQGSHGKRTDIDDVISSIDAGERDIKKLRRLFPAVLCKYEEFVLRILRDSAPKAQHAPTFQFSPWQQQLSDDLEAPPDPRKIFFIVDHQGHVGKSWFIRRYKDLHNEDDGLCAFSLKPCKKSDLALLLPVEPSPRVLFVDVPRGGSEHMDYLYSFLEDVKDGTVVSPKYNSCVKDLPPMHVVVFMNQDPDLTKLSQDRFIVRHVTSDWVDAPAAAPLPAFVPGFNPGPDRVRN